VAEQAKSSEAARGVATRVQRLSLCQAPAVNELKQQTRPGKAVEAGVRKARRMNEGRWWAGRKRATSRQVEGSAAVVGACVRQFMFVQRPAHGTRPPPTGALFARNCSKKV